MGSIKFFKEYPKMPENQGHGKTWEKDLGINVYGATETELESISHTAAIDIPRAINRLEGIDISIKVSKNDTIDMADIVRVYDEVSSEEKIHMTVIIWQQINETTKKIKSITEVDLTSSVKLLFGSVKREQLVTLVNMAKAVGKVRPDVSPEQRASQITSAYAFRDEIQKESGYMHFHLMFYTNNASRVQGQFKHFLDFVKKNPERLIAESQTGDFRGGKIKEEITSTKRIRNKKPTPHLIPH